LMKHFELPVDEIDLTKTVRLETRFLVHGEDGQWYGLTYRWRPDQTDADLLATDETQEYTIRGADGATRKQTWYFPSRLDCTSCHRQGSGGALGPRTHQLNREFSYSGTGRTDNQLRAWNHAGLFSQQLEEPNVPLMPSAPPLSDVTAPLQERARSWLDANCSYCHRPGEVNAGFDARFTTPFAVQQLLWTGVRNDLGNPGTVVIYPGNPELSAAWQRTASVGPIAMPPLAKTIAPDSAVDLLSAWIERVDPELPQTGLRYEYYEVTGVDVLPDFDSLVPVSTGTSSTPGLAVREHDDYFALRFTGYLGIENAGDYTFYTSSDDGSQLFIDGGLVVDNDGLHEVQEQAGVVSLSSGYHEIVVTMFEADGGEILETSWAGPDTVGAKVPLGPGGLFRELPTGPVNGIPALANPGNQRNRLGDGVALDLVATDDDGDALYFDAAGLPEGLLVDHDSGHISGTLAISGTSFVTASASDGPDVAVVQFEWTVDAVSGSMAPLHEHPTTLDDHE